MTTLGDEYGSLESSFDRRTRAMQDVHEVMDSYSKEAFIKWMRTSVYQTPLAYQNMPTLNFLLNFAIEHNYLDKQGYILDEIIRTKKHLDENT